MWLKKMTLISQNNHEIALPDFKPIIFKIINIGKRRGNYYITVTDSPWNNQMIFQNKEVKVGKKESVFKKTLKQLDIKKERFNFYIIP